MIEQKDLQVNKTYYSYKYEIANKMDKFAKVYGIFSFSFDEDKNIEVKFLTKKGNISDQMLLNTKHMIKMPKYYFLSFFESLDECTIEHDKYLSSIRQNNPLYFDGFKISKTNSKNEAKEFLSKLSKSELHIIDQLITAGKGTHTYLK